APCGTGRRVTQDSFVGVLLSDFERMRQLETERGLRGQHDVFVSGESGPACPRASASGQSDGSPFSSAGKAADQSAECSASAGHYSCTLAFALGSESLRCGSNGKISAVQVDRVKAHLK